MFRKSEADAREVYVLGLIFVVTAYRLFYASALPLTADEAYYWQWSRHLAWGYFDHPPLIAWIIAAGTGIVGINPLGVRMFPIILAAGTAWMVYRMVTDLDRDTGQNAGLWALGFMLFTPLLATGAVLATPDVPFVFFWTAAAWRIQKGVSGIGNRAWVEAGIMTGLGLLSKLPMTILPPALLVALLSTNKGRRVLLSPGPWLAGLLAAAVCMPYVLWIASRGWEPLLYQLGHGLGGSGGVHRSGSFLLFLTGQLAVTGLLVFPVAMLGLFHGVKRWRDRSQNEDTRTVLNLWTALGVVTLFSFAGASFLARSGPNWPVAMYPTAFALSGIMISRWKKGGKIFAGISLALAALLSLYVQVEAVRPLVPYNPRGFFSKVQDRGKVARWAEGIRNALGEKGRRIHILADSYQLASLLAFYLPDHPETDSLLEKGSGSEYARWRKKVNKGEWVLYFTTRDRAPDYLSELTTVGTMVETRLGREVDVISAKSGKLKEDRPDDP